MEITVNGEKKQLAAMSVSTFLRTLDINPQLVAIELNLNILPKADYEATVLNDGDCLEIVHFVGGG